MAVIYIGTRVKIKYGNHCRNLRRGVGPTRVSASERLPRCRCERSLCGQPYLLPVRSVACGGFGSVYIYFLKV